MTRCLCPIPLDCPATEFPTRGVEVGIVQGVVLRIGSLDETSRPQVRDLLTSLSDADRRLRFMRLMSDQAIDAYATAMVFGGSIRLGVWTSEGTLVAMVEGFVYTTGGQSTMEVAFTTNPAWRRNGLAEALSHAVIIEAAARGVRRIVACCDARNTSMRALLAAVHAASETDAGEVNATWPPEAVDGVADPMSALRGSIGARDGGAARRGA